MRDAFRKFAYWASDLMGSPWAFFVAVATVLAWAATGPLFDYSDSWQLVINTGTTIVTFLMVFLIQNTQNRDAKAMHLKLDELLRGVKGARTSLVNLEDWTDDELKELHREFSRLRGRLERRAAPLPEEPPDAPDAPQRRPGAPPDELSERRSA